MKTITLANLAEATEQEVYDHVVTHLKKQNKKSQLYDKPYGGTVCAYRSDDNLMCAAGCLMTDAEYEHLKSTYYNSHEDDDFNTSTWNEIIGCGVTDAHYDLIFELQLIHDHDNVSQWSKKLISLAKLFDLDPKLALEWSNENV